MTDQYRDLAEKMARDLAKPENAAQLGDRWQEPYLEEILRRAYPNGHHNFIPVMLEKMKLHSDKNHDYAGGGPPLGNFERVSFILGQYPGLDLGDPVVVMLIYALKQVDAVMWGLAKNLDQKVEGPIERLSDILVYSGIAICALQTRTPLTNIKIQGTVHPEGEDPHPITGVPGRGRDAEIY